MIKINRNEVKIPDILKNDPKKGGFKETVKIIKYYDVPNASKLKTYPNFNVYKNITVKEALKELFNKKCAYCESLFLHVYIGDVEHFRPKGGFMIGKELIQPGYYWLAADWDNLLLSCRNCNQASSELNYGGLEPISIGKMNKFPLLDESKRVRKHNHTNGIQQEESVRLIIDPCKDNPEKYFKYDPKNGVIKVKDTLTKKEKKIAQTSIDVFALQRVSLVQARERKVIKIKAQMQRIKDAIEYIDKNIDNKNNAIRFLNSAYFIKELDKLYEFLKNDSEYLGLARQMISEFKKTNFDRINILLSS